MGGKQEGFAVFEVFKLLGSPTTQSKFRRAGWLRGLLCFLLVCNVFP